MIAQVSHPDTNPIERGSGRLAPLTTAEALAWRLEQHQMGYGHGLEHYCPHKLAERSPWYRQGYVAGLGDRAADFTTHLEQCYGVTAK